MARPRRQPQQPPVARATEPPVAARVQAPVESPVDAEPPEQARLADFLVALVAEHARDRLDPEAPGMAEYWRWKARQAHDALAPAERAALRDEARAFARRMRAELESRRQDEPGGEVPAGDT